MIHHRSGGVLAAILSATFLAPAPGCAQGSSPALILTDATVLPMTGAAPLRSQTLVIEGGRITRLGPAATIQPPAGSQAISLSGKVVIPGLADMHVHNIVRDRWRLLGHGITAVRGMWGVPSHAALRDSVARGTAVGPWITLASPGLDARPGFWPLTQFIDSLGDVVPTVRRLKGEGWTWLKIYTRLSRAAYDSIVTTARALDIPFLGHVPLAVPVEHALEAGQLTIEHLSGYDMALRHFGDSPGADSSRMLELVRATVRAGTWNCPTLAIIAEFARRGPGPDADRVIVNRRRLVRALYQGGARLLIGTDSGIDVVPAGSALSDEMGEFVAAGIPVDTVLRIATRDAARFLGQSDQWGAVAVGMRADLLVLDQDPTRDLETLKSPAGLVLHGTWVPADTLARWRER
jgi:imidazolonepropionase-like amidohydrolase